MEAEAILGVLTLCEAAQLELMSSEALLLELERNPHSVRKEYALKVLAKAVVFIHTAVISRNLRGDFKPKEVTPLDALHISVGSDC